jgi:hypothetical protein
MIPAIAIGDSIAVGTSQALHIPAYAKERMGSCWILAHMPKRIDAERVVISAGVNDPPGRCDAAIRARIHSYNVVWIRPVNSASVTVDSIAKRYCDSVISYVVGPDHLHPQSYGEIAVTVKFEWNAHH